MPGWTFEEPNPITRCAIQIGLAGRLPPATLREIAATHGQFKRELPRKVEQQMLTFPMGGFAAPMGFQPLPDLGAVVFDYVNPLGGSARGLIVGPNAINYFTASYTRWEEFWPFANRLLTEVCRYALPIVPSASISLEYHDNFKWERATDELDLNLLFQDDGEYLPNRFLSQKNICHNFEGWAHRQAEPQGRLLNNINVSVAKLPNEDTFTCTIVIGHSRQFDVPLDLAGFSTIFEREMNEMHRRNKGVLLSILNRDVEERIPGLRE